MGIESDLKKRMRMNATRKAVLTGLQLGGLLTIAVLAPNVAGVLAREYNRREYARTRHVLMRLAIKGLVVKKKGGYALTDKGRRVLDRETLSPARPKRWDGKWRIVIFDIPESRKVYRNVLRDSLKRIGFLKLQHSAWIYPYDCEELVALLKAEYSLGKEVLYMVVDALENDRAMREHFKLKRR